jgi:hypothetical protein
MRTTLTIDEDIAVQIEELRRKRDASLKDVVNEALRLGMREMKAPAKRRKPFRTKPIAMGKALIDINNVAEVIAYVEGDDHK